MELVLDASVILKWFLPEEESPQAQKLRQKHLKGEAFIYAPSLLIFEVANALVTKKELTESDVEKALSIFFFTDLNFIEFSQILVNSAALTARKYRISVYDTSYITLAKTLAAKFITADRKLFEKVKSLGFVELLS